MTTPIRLWHGGHRWEGPPQLRPAGKGHSEHGSGLYLTTSAETARKYAKGGGSTYLVELSPDLHWLNEAKLSLDTIQSFLKDRRGLKKRDLIWSDILRASERMKSKTLPAEYLVNLMVNHDALKGDHGPALAMFLVQQGIDAAFVEPPMRSSTEDWVVVFNMNKIVSVKKTPANEDMPRLKRPGVTADLLDEAANRVEAADDYRISHEAPGEEGAPLHDLTMNQVYPKDVYETLQHYGTGEPEMDAMAFSAIRQFHGKPDELKRIWRAVPIGVRQINDGDWVTIVKQYAKDHAESVGSDANPMWVISARVPASMLFTDGNSLLEWGYNGPSRMAPADSAGLLLEKKLKKTKKAAS